MILPVILRTSWPLARPKKASPNACTPRPGWHYGVYIALLACVFSPDVNLAQEQGCSRNHAHGFCQQQFAILDCNAPCVCNSYYTYASSSTTTRFPCSARAMLPDVLLLLQLSILYVTVYFSGVRTHEGRQWCLTKAHKAVNTENFLLPTIITRVLAGLSTGPGGLLVFTALTHVVTYYLAIR